MAPSGLFRGAILVKVLLLLEFRLLVLGVILFHFAKGFQQLRSQQSRLLEVGKHLLEVALVLKGEAHEIAFKPPLQATTKKKL